LNAPEITEDKIQIIIGLSPWFMRGWEFFSSYGSEYLSAKRTVPLCFSVTNLGAEVHQRKRKPARKDQRSQKTNQAI